MEELVALKTLELLRLPPGFKAILTVAVTRLIEVFPKKVVALLPEEFVEYVTWTQ